MEEQQVLQEQEMNTLINRLEVLEREKEPEPEVYLLIIHIKKHIQDAKRVPEESKKKRCTIL